MIKQICMKHEWWDSKRNWIDHNNVVFGYSDDRQCCEHFGWAVYDPKTRQKVADDIDEMPYHFDFAKGVREISSEDRPFFLEYEGDGVLDSHNNIIQIDLLPDDENDPMLVFECFNCHNGYYYHDFSLKKNEKGGAK